MTEFEEIIKFIKARIREDAEWAAHSTLTGRRYDTARIYRQVDSMRNILSEHAPDLKDPERCRVCTAIANGNARRFRGPCWTVKNLAVFWSDHPDFQLSWMYA